MLRRAAREPKALLVLREGGRRHQGAPGLQRQAEPENQIRCAVAANHLLRLDTVPLRNGGAQRPAQGVRIVDGLRDRLPGGLGHLGRHPQRM